MDDKKVILLTFLILIISLISFNLGSGITSNVTANRQGSSQILLDSDVIKNGVNECGSIKVTVLPSNKGIINAGLTSPVYVDLYRENGGKVSGASLKVCKQGKRCYKQDERRYLAIPCNVLQDPKLRSGRFYVKGYDGSNVAIKSPLFTVYNIDELKTNSRR